MKYSQITLIVWLFMIGTSLGLVLSQQNAVNRIENHVSTPDLRITEEPKSAAPTFGQIFIDEDADLISLATTYPAYFVFTSGQWYIRNFEIDCNRTALLGESNKKWGIFLYEYSSFVVHIENVTIYNSVDPVAYNTTGIILYNSHNHIIHDVKIHDTAIGVFVNVSNTVTTEYSRIWNNKGDGIVYRLSNSMTVQYNNISQNLGIGVSVLGGGVGTIQYNDIKGNSYGIYTIDMSGALVITRNNATWNNYNGIHAHGSLTLTISYNNASLNYGNGITATNRNGVPTTIITENDANRNNESGIVIANRFYTTVTNNRVKFNRYSGIMVAGGSNNLLSNNDMINNSYYGLVVDGEANFIADASSSANDIYNNSVAGVLIKDSTNTQLNDNNINNNTIGVILENNGTIISGGQINGNFQDGVLISGGRNRITTNTQIYYNRQNGVTITGKDNFLLNLINVNDNGIYGVALLNEYNTVDNIRVHRNHDSGIFMSSSSNRITYADLFDNWRYAIQLEGYNNTLSNNEMHLTGVFMIPDTMTNMKSHTFTSNTINGRTIYLYKSTTGTVIPSAHGQVIAIDCKDMHNSVASSSDCVSTAFALYYCNATTIDNWVFRYTPASAIYLYQSNFTTITRSGFISTTYGISGTASNTWINNCTFTSNNNTAISIIGTSNGVNWTKITQTSVDGIALSGTSISISNCQVSQSGRYGMMITGVSISIINNTLNSNTNNAVELNIASNANIWNNDFSGNTGKSISLTSVSSSSVTENRITNTVQASIYVDSCTTVSVSSNTITGTGIKLQGSSPAHFTDLTILSNTRNGLPIIYYKNQDRLSDVLSTVGQLILFNISNCTIKGFMISGAIINLQLFYCMDSTLNGTVTAGIEQNIYMFASNGNTFNEMKIENAATGFGATGYMSNTNTFLKCWFTGNQIGLNLVTSNSNVVQNSWFNLNPTAIIVINSQFNYIKVTHINNSNTCGISIDGGDSNILETITFENMGTDLTDTVIKLTNTLNSRIRSSSLVKIAISGIRLYNADQTDIEETTITDCTSPTNAIYIDAATTDVTIYKVNIAFKTILPNTYGIELYGSDVLIQATTISRAYTGIGGESASSINIELSSISQCSNGVYFVLSQDLTFDGNTITNISVYCVYVANSSQIYIKSNNFRNAYYGIYCLSSQGVSGRLNIFCKITQNILYIDGEGSIILSMGCSDETGGTGSNVNEMKKIERLNPTLVWFLQYFMPFPLFILGLLFGRKAYLKSKSLG